MPYVRTLKTASGATAVQIVYSFHRGSRQIEHAGSAHSEAELELLKAAARQKLGAGQVCWTWAWPRLRRRAGAALLVVGDEVRLRQIIGNLMSNALTHTPDGTRDRRADQVGQPGRGAGPPPPPPPDWPDQDETGFGGDSLNPDWYEQVCRWFTS